MDMLFSVIIPVYNYADYLESAVRSVLDQAGDDFEIVIIDDGSTDDTAQVAERLVNEAPERIRFIRQENRGPGAARNRGVEAAGGDFCLFLDADDRLTDQALAAFRKVLQRHPQVGMVLAGHVSVHPDGRRREHRPPALALDPKQNFQAYLRKRVNVSNGASVIARRVFRHFRFPEDIRNGEDVALFAKIFALYECRAIPELVLEIRKHDDSLRNQVDLILRSGDKVVDYVFDAKLLPTWALAYRAEFSARQAMSLFRACYVAGRYAEARRFFRDAVRQRPQLLFNLAYLRKYLRIAFK